MDAEIEKLIGDLSDVEDEGSPQQIKEGFAMPNTHTEMEQLVSRVSEISDTMHERLVRLQTISGHELGLRANGMNLEDYLAYVRTFYDDQVDANSKGQYFREILGHNTSIQLMIDQSHNMPQPTSDSNDNRIQRLHAEIMELLDQRSEKVRDLEQEIAQKMPNTLKIVSLPTTVQLVLGLGGLHQVATCQPSNMANPHKSFISGDPLIQEIPESKKRAALRIIGSKVVLAARLDANQVDTISSPVANTWAINVRKRLEALVGPHASIQMRSLPKPKDLKKSRRGGRRARQQKQKRLALTGDPEITRFH